MRSIAEDLRYGSRILLKHPLWTLSAVLALGVGIAFNSTMFSVSDVLLFRPLVVPEMDRLVVVNGQRKGNANSRRPIAPVAWQAIREQSTTLDSLAAIREWETNLTGEQKPQRVSAFQVSASFFDAMEVKPIVGRAFTPADETEGGHRVVLLTHAVWEQRFGADQSVIGQTVRLNGEPYAVVGVMPDDFRFPLTVEVWTPLSLSPKERAEDNNFYLRAMGRLKPGVTKEQADAEMAAIFAQVAEKFPATNGQLTARTRVLRDEIAGDLTREYTYMMIGAAGFLLLICCANVANLQFARFMTRTREMSIRSAMGASRRRLLRQLLSENLLLAMLGGLVSLAIAFWCVDLIRTSMPPEVEQYLPGWHRMGLNPRALLYTMAMVMVAAVTAGMMPALLLSRAPAAENLKDSSRGATGSRSRARLRGILVVSQVVLALVLLAGASLMIKGFGAILNLWPNVEAEKVLTFRLALPQSRYPTDSAREQFLSRLLDRLRNTTGATQASLISSLPQSQRNMSTPVTVEGETQDPKFRLIANYESAGEDYFRLMRIPIKEGRGIEATDREGAERVAVVSEAFVKQILHGGQAIGRRVAFGPAQENPEWLTIVGVAGDVLQDYTDRISRPILYTSFRQYAERANDFVIRTTGDPLQLAPAIRQAIESIDADQPVYDMRTYRQLVRHGLAGIGYVAGMMGVLGLVALFLSVLGIYSLVAYAVSERTREFGVRLALGAPRQSILWMVLRQGFWLVGVGLLIGLPMAYGAVRMLSGLVFGVSPTDVIAFGVVPLLLAITAAAASYWPALRATRTDPTTALHYE